MDIAFPLILQLMHAKIHDRKKIQRKRLKFTVRVKYGDTFCNHSTWEAAIGKLRIGGQSGRHNKDH